MRKSQGTLEAAQLEAVINDFVSRELVRDVALLPLENATPLLETDVLDSLSLLSMVLFIRERFGIEVEDVDLIPENFASVDAICAYLRTRTGETAGQAGPVTDAATKAEGPARQPRLGWAGRPGTVLARLLLRRGGNLAYWMTVAPLAARLPARLAYGFACWQGDLMYRYWGGKRSEVLHNLSQVLGEGLSQEEAERLARDLFRFRWCEIIDAMRLRGRGRSLGRLVEIRGREHLDAALAEGKGAILCTAHLGSVLATFSVLHENGFPLTTIGRWWWNYTPGVSSAERRSWDFLLARRVLRHRQRPNIEPWPGHVQVAAQAAAALRANEVVTIFSDAAPLDADRTRTIDMPLLGRKARLLPGVVPLAQLTGAPVLMAFVYRSPDYRHQVLEISPPVPMDGEIETAFERCVAAIDTAISARPAHWCFWFETDDLEKLGLL